MTLRSKPDSLTAAVVVIGNEILTGRTQDSNTSWIAEKLLARGIAIREVRIIPDDEEAIIRSVNELRSKHNYVFTTGGIGPTHDDITAECVARAFGLGMEQNEEAFRMLEQYYGLENLTPPRAKMASVPIGSRLIPNPVSAAPGFIVENVYVMAGVPRIMHAMLDHIIDMLKVGKPVLSNTVACTTPESMLAEDLSRLQDRYPEIEIGSYPHFRGGVLGLSLVLRSTEEDRLEKATDELVAIIRKHGDEPRALSVRMKGDRPATSAV